MGGLPENPIAAVIVVLILVLFGTGAGGAVVALRKDRRQADRDEIDLTQLVREVATAQIRALSDRVEKLQSELDTVRTQSVRDMRAERNRADTEILLVSTRLNKRIAQLENSIRRIPGGIVPPWPEDTPPRGVTQ